MNGFIILYHFIELHYTVLMCTHISFCNALHFIFSLKYWIELDFTALYPFMTYITALHFTALDYTTLHCTALYCTALYCTALHCTGLHCIGLLGIALHCTVLHCTTLLCIALQCTALHCTHMRRWWWYVSDQGRIRTVASLADDISYLCTPVQCITVQCSAFKYTAVQCIVVQCI